MKKTDTKIKISPSILAADFGRLAEESKRAESAGADSLHIDIMDGHFVRNLTMGPQAVAAINRSTNLFLDVHLMIYNPYEYIEQFVKAGADNITIHLESTEDVEDTLKFIRKCNVKAGLAFNPETSMSLIPKYLDQCDLILLMTVNPGFGGQELITDVLDKVSFTRDVCKQLKIPMDIQVDGGITFANVDQCVDAGANVIVAGTTLFQSSNLKEAIEKMRKAASKQQE